MARIVFQTGRRRRFFRRGRGGGIGGGVMIGLFLFILILAIVGYMYASKSNQAKSKDIQKAYKSCNDVHPNRYNQCTTCM